MNNIPKVIDLVVKNDLCIGCGLCIYKCPNKALEMKWDEFGFLIPALNGNCDLMGDCITVCPFNPFPEKEVETENELAELFLNKAIFHHPKIGKYQGIYAGYANEFRLNSSSGGLATYIFSELLERGIVDYIFSVKESLTSESHYEYSISNTKQELLQAAKTKYYPVSLSTVFLKINAFQGKVAIIGVSCFIKAIRLAQNDDIKLKEKIPFLVGIICGGVKSKFFTEYLACKSGVNINQYQKPQYRIKDIKSSALDYTFGCYDTLNKSTKTIKMQLVGDMWGTGLFKANACDFCDDVANELADISLGDAWIEPYINDGNGTNVIITRSNLAENIIQEGIKNSKLKLDIIKSEHFILSQQGNYNHRQKGLPARIKYVKNNKMLIPPKRFVDSTVYLDFKIVQILRMKLRKVSLIKWRNFKTIEKFEKEISAYKGILWRFTKIYHIRRLFLK